MSKKLLGKSEKEIEIERVAGDVVEILLLRQNIMAEAGRHYNLSKRFGCFALEATVRTETEKDPGHNEFPIEERGEHMVTNMYGNCALQSVLKKFIYDKFSKRKPAASDLLFELLGFGIFELKRRGWGKGWGHGRKCILAV